MSDTKNALEEAVKAETIKDLNTAGDRIVDVRWENHKTKDYSIAIYTVIQKILLLNIDGGTDEVLAVTYLVRAEDSNIKQMSMDDMLKVYPSVLDTYTYKYYKIKLDDNKTRKSDLYKFTK